MNTNLRTLGPSEAKVVLSLREQGRAIVSAEDVIELVGHEKTARKVISSLLKKGWFTHLVAGRYLFLPPERGPENLGENNALAVASAVIVPSYVGWWAAASYHGFTTQKPAAISVATLRFMPARTIEGTEIRFVKVVERKFFGFTPRDVYGREATISTPVKTVVDCVDRPDLAGGSSEVARIVFGASSNLNADEVVHTAMQMKSSALLQRLGFLMDLVGWSPSKDACAKMRAAIGPTARSYLGRVKPKRGDLGYVAKWGLFVHTSGSALLADVPTAKALLAR